MEERDENVMIREAVERVKEEDNEGDIGKIVGFGVGGAAYALDLPKE